MMTKSNLSSTRNSQSDALRMMLLQLDHKISEITDLKEQISLNIDRESDNPYASNSERQQIGHLIRTQFIPILRQELDR